MSDSYLTRIVELALELDQLAAGIYHNLAANTAVSELKEFWANMAEESRQQTASWHSLREMTSNDSLPQLFADPPSVIYELSGQSEKIGLLTEQSSGTRSHVEQFVLAFRLEFLLLHPAIERLRHFFGLFQEDGGPAGRQEAHIRRFIVAMRQYGVSSMELEALGETVESTWLHAKEQAEDATRDQLTGVMNRQGMIAAMNTLGYLAKRNRFHSGVLLVDIDDFKTVNKNLGHQEGDRLLRRLAALLLDCRRESDVVGRFGGQEFLVFLPDVSHEGLQLVADKMRLAIATSTAGGTHVTACVGAAGCSMTGNVERHVELMLRQAEKNLGEAKRVGTNRTVCSEVEA